ncbi:putative ribonuclease H-like domain-containing protein [Tanacetum coccineum]
MAKFANIGFDCLLSLDEKVCHMFIYEFYKTLHLDRYPSNHLSIQFVINNHRFNISLAQFSEFTSLPNQGICIYSDAWGLDELEKTLEKIPPYNSRLPAIDDIQNEVILNGDSPLPTRTVNGIETSVPPTTAEQKLARKNDTNEAVKTAHGVFVANSKDNASTLPNVDSLSDAVIYSFFARDGLEVVDGNADNKSKEISQEDRKESWWPPRYKTTEQGDNKKYGFGYDWSDQAEEGPTNFSLMAYTSSGSLFLVLQFQIRGIENQINHRVEFKNKEMNQFCKMKGIKREFSVARTPQQNEVAIRKNRTLIEAARIMLADSKLPTTFWAEAVNTACYVQNRVLVIKPHNKTPYELLHGRTPSLSFMRPFGCPVTILNTLDHLVVAGNQTNDSAGTNECDNVGKARVETDSPDAGFKPSGEEEKKDVKHPENEDSEELNIEEPRVNQEKDENVNSANNINTVSSTINTASIKDNVIDENIVYGCDDDPNMPNFEEIVYSDDDEDVVKEGDMNNLESSITVSPIATTRVHKDHLVEQIIGDLHSAPQTRRMTKSVTDHVEPKKVIQALIDPSWNRSQCRKSFSIMDVKSAFLYGKIEEAYVCQPPGFEDPEFPDKVYKVEKALYGLHQAPRAWKEMCTDFETMMNKKFQMSSLGELIVFLGLQVTQKNNGIFISQDKYVEEILKKFDFSTVKTASTPMETSKPLLKDAEAEDIDVHLYRSMIGSLIYLTASRPDIMFVVCACARFQVTPKVSHLHAVKRIFRYLKGQPKLGLWYPKDSPFDLEAYTDSDYAGASLDRKSTTGGCQFLGRRLISWQCKKQTIVANSTTEAEYVAAASCCGQNPVFHSKTKHIEIRHHFIRDSNEKKLIQMIKIHTDHNVADLLTKAFDVGRFQYLIASIGMLNL